MNAGNPRSSSFERSGVRMTFTSESGRENVDIFAANVADLRLGMICLERSWARLSIYLEVEAVGASCGVLMTAMIHRSCV